MKCKNDIIISIDRRKVELEKFSESSELGVENLVNLEFNNKVIIFFVKAFYYEEHNNETKDEYRASLLSFK